jgi:hypothetical protein
MSIVNAAAPGGLVVCRRMGVVVVIAASAVVIIADKKDKKRHLIGVNQFLLRAPRAEGGERALHVDAWQMETFDLPLTATRTVLLTMGGAVAR